MSASHVASIAVLGGVLAAAQQVAIVPRVHPETKVLHTSTFRLDVKLIQIPVNVTDGMDRPVRGLERGAFRVFEDDVEQQVASFSSGDAAVSAGLVFDTSGSMKNRIDESREAVRQFLETGVRGDEYFLMRFSDNAELLAPFTGESGEISRQLELLRPHGWTALVDAVCRSVAEMRRASNSRHVLLVLTDGADNNSRYSEGELVSILREADVRIFAIGLFERPRLLERLADESGGGVIWVRKLPELRGAMEKLSLQIRNEYVLGYFSDHAQNDGRYHRVRIEVAPPDGGRLRATWRRGYVAD